MKTENGAKTKKQGFAEEPGREAVVAVHIQLFILLLPHSVTR